MHAIVGIIIAAGVTKFRADTRRPGRIKRVAGFGVAAKGPDVIAAVFASLPRQRAAEIPSLVEFAVEIETRRVRLLIAPAAFTDNVAVVVVLNDIEKVRLQ